jgi:hypothetical protein
MASDKILNAIEKKIDINVVLSELLGSEFPATDKIAKNFDEAAINYYQNTEEFISHLFPVDIHYSLCIDCKITQNGWRPFFLSSFLRKQGFLQHNKTLDFFIKNTNCSKPYSIYWKVRNVGDIAEKRDNIRGQIKKTDSDHHKEHTDFQGEHFVECYLVKNGICIAKNRIDVPIGAV